MEQVGIQLVADGADKYIASLNAAAAAETKVASSADPAAAAINDLGGDAQKSGKALTEMGNDAEQGSKDLTGLGQVATGAARAVGELLVNAAAQAGQAIVQFVGDSIDKAGDFESGMKRFASVTGDSLAQSGQSLDDFKQLFISLGRDLPVSTAEVQQAAIEMAKGGIEPATIAAGGLKDVLALAAAGEVDIAQAAEIAAKQLGVWSSAGDTAAQKAQFLKESSDLLAQAANASTVNVDDLALGMANAGGIAKVAGLSFRETVTTMALLAPGFSSAADAGTSLKTMLTRLQPTTDAAQQAMKQLGLLTSQGTSKFYDATGAFVGMDKAASLLHDSLDGMGQAQKTATLQAIFGNDAFRAAALLAERGSAGYQEMAKNMAGAGTAAEQAAKKQEGFNVAMENLGGSVEALQIILGSALLPVLTKVVNLLASGVNAITDYADATIKGETALSTIADVLKTGLVPALTGATAAAIAYALAQTGSLIPSILSSLPAIAAQTEAFFANAAATLAAVAPYALIAAAVAGVVYAYQNFNKTVEDATTQLLNSRQWWLDSAAAIEDYGNQTGDAQKKLAPYAATITQLRTQIQGEIEDLGRRSAAGLVSQQQYDSEMATINAHRAGLIQVTDAYNEQEKAILAQTAASMTATNQIATMQGADAALGQQVSLTAKDIEDLGKKIQDTYTKGQEALTAYAQNYSVFASGVEQRSSEHADKIAQLETQKQQATTSEQKKGIDDQIKQVNAAYASQEESAAQSYARQQQAQQQHLGQMLIDYTVAQAQLGNIAKEKAAEITAALEKEYGLQQSSTATTFLHMADSIDKFASSSGSSIDKLVGDLRSQQTQAGETQRAMDAYAKEYVAKQTNNFLEGKIDADEYRRSIENIPSQKTITITTEYKSTGKGGESSDLVTPTNPNKRASGGSVEPGQAYLVGEQGPEMIVPSQAGTVLNAGETRRAMAGSQVSGVVGGSVYNTETVINVDARGSNLTEADITRGVQAGLMAEGRNVDVRVRTGAAF